MAESLIPKSLLFQLKPIPLILAEPFTFMVTLEIFTSFASTNITVPVDE
jgi:hypothetical protein